MAFRSKPIFVATDYGPQLVAVGSLEFLAQGIDGRGYHVTMTRHLAVSGPPIGAVMPSDRIGAMTDARLSRPVPINYNVRPTYEKVQGMSQPLWTGMAETTTYEKRATNAQTPGGMLYAFAGTTFNRPFIQTLEAFERQTLIVKKEQLAEKALDEKRQKILDGLTELLSLASTAFAVASIILPAARIGSITLELIKDSLKAHAALASAASNFYKSINGDEQAAIKLQFDLLSEVLNPVLKSKAIMPGWGRTCSRMALKGIEAYRLRDASTPTASAYDVEADLTLDQIYRFRCVMDPTKAKRDEEAFAMLRKNTALLGLFNAYGLPKPN